MKHIATICLLALTLTACNVKSDQHLQQRIVTLEQRIIDLENQLQQNASALPLSTSKHDDVAPSQSVMRVSFDGQCKGITKKGYQCSRKGKHAGYCYQHNK